MATQRASAQLCGPGTPAIKPYRHLRVSLHCRVNGEEDTLSRDMGSVAVSDESSEQQLIEAVGPRRWRLSKQELQVYRRAMAPGDREEVGVRVRVSDQGLGLGLGLG